MGRSHSDSDVAAAVVDAARKEDDSRRDWENGSRRRWRRKLAVIGDDAKC